MYPFSNPFRTPSFNQNADNNPIARLGNLMRPKPKLPMGDRPELPAGLSPMPEMPAAKPQQIEMPASDNFRLTLPTEMRPAGQAMNPPAPIPLSDVRPQQMGRLEAPQRIPMPNPRLLDSGREVAPDSIAAQRQEYMLKGAKRLPDGTFDPGKDGGIQYKRSGKDIALAALAGLGKGGVLGAAIGGIGAAVSPKFGRELNYDAYEKPRAIEDRQMTMQDDALRRQTMLDALRIQREQVGLDQEKAQTDLYKAQTDKALNPAIRPQAPRSVRLSPMQMPDGSSVLVDLNDPENAGREFRPFQRPEKPLSAPEAEKEAEIEQTATEGDPEQIAEDSYQGRGGDQYVFGRLPLQVQQIISTGKVNGMDATPEESAGAQRAWAQAIERERKSILDYTKGQARTKTSKRAVGKRPGPASATGTRSLRELSSKYFNE